LITDRHVNLIYNLIHSNRASGKIYLPNNIRVVKSYNNLTVIEEKLKNNEYEIELIDYVNLPNGKNIEFVTEASSNSNNYLRLDSSEITLPLHVRSKQNGDKMYVKGMLGRKKISDIFIDAKIPVEERKLWPIVVDSAGQIVWVPGLKKSKFDKSKSEKYDIILKYY